MIILHRLVTTALSLFNFAQNGTGRGPRTLQNYPNPPSSYTFSRRPSYSMRKYPPFKEFGRRLKGGYFHLGVWLWRPDVVPENTVFALEITQNRFQNLKIFACGAPDLSRSQRDWRGGIFSRNITDLFGCKSVQNYIYTNMTAFRHVHNHRAVWWSCLSIPRGEMLHTVLRIPVRTMSSTDSLEKTLGPPPRGRPE